jgi:hypothetical protein
MPTIKRIGGLRVVTLVADLAHLCDEWGGFMAIRNDEYTAANKRAAERQRKTPTATAVRYDRRIGRIVIDLSSGIEIA